MLIIIIIVYSKRTELGEIDPMLYLTVCMTFRNLILIILSHVEKLKRMFEYFNVL